MKFSLLAFILAAFGMHALNAVDLVQCNIYFLGIPTGQFFEKGKIVHAHMRWRINNSIIAPVQ